MKKHIFTLAFLLGVVCTAHSKPKQISNSKAISPDLIGVFFEDTNYAADGGLYAELIQNRSFEYSPTDHSGWNSFTAWEYITQGYGYGALSVETTSPIHPNNCLLYTSPSPRD